MSDVIANLQEFASNAKAWPFAEARDLAKRLEKSGGGDTVLFETGYGPSGLPHIGTFGEVVRTSMVRKAFETLTGANTRLVCFSDDMDGLRKVPDNIPDGDRLLSSYLGMPLTEVADPFGTHSSFGAHNNARLQAFLDSFGFEYEFVSSTDCYKSGQFDDGLRTALSRYDAIMDIMLPTLGAERRETYSPFFPVCADTGKVLQAKVIATHPDRDSITYLDPDTGSEIETLVTGGACKLQWKADWAMRWFVLGVDYEMAGKDLIDSVRQSSKITRALGGNPPIGISYELFLDAAGEKISKSKGNGLSVEEWLRYGNPESLSLFMYAQPRRAKRMHFDVIPKTVDEYYQHCNKAGDQTPAELLENPAWHIHGRAPGASGLPVSYTLLLNLASVCLAESPDIIWRYVSDYVPGVSAETHPELDRMIGYAVTYYQDRVRPQKIYRAADTVEAGHIEKLIAALETLSDTAAGEDFQSAVYSIGTAAGYENLRSWFQCLYEVLLGQSEGPRMGSFFALYGRTQSMDLMRDALAGKLVAQTSGGDAK
ncbi:lysine--tRNA ligase [Alphaproteobacteria bacterium]|jgi:lysyl-tRNA synthetase class 1|nr:lysine--tRNA ligase [Alphaproteobacteria bacterium]